MLITREWNRMKIHSIYSLHTLILQLGGYCQCEINLLLSLFLFNSNNVLRAHLLINAQYLLSKFLDIGTRYYIPSL